MDQTAKEGAEVGEPSGANEAGAGDGGHEGGTAQGVQFSMWSAALICLALLQPLGMHTGVAGARGRQHSWRKKRGRTAGAWTNEAHSEARANF